MPLFKYPIKKGTFMKQLSLLSALCALMFIHSSLRAPALKGGGASVPSVSQSMQAASDAAYIPVRMISAVDDIIKADLPKITLDNLQDVESGFKIAWPDLLEKLNAIKKDENEYTKYVKAGVASPSGQMDKAKSKVVMIQDKIVAFLNTVESAIEDEKTELELRKRLLNAYDTLTKDWTANPYGIDADYKSIIADLIKKVQAAEPQQAYVPQSIPRPAGMFRGAPDNRNKN
jgi:hypothetical protein